MFSRRLVVVLVAGLSLAGHEARAQKDAQKEAQEDARLQQYVQLLQPVMWQELNFVRQICDLTPEQRPKIREAGDSAVKEGAKAIVQPQQAAVRQQVAAGRLSQPTLGAQTTRDSLREALKKTLSAKQLQRYETEEAERA